MPPRPGLRALLQRRRLYTTGIDCDGHGHRDGAGRPTERSGAGPQPQAQPGHHPWGFYQITDRICRERPEVVQHASRQGSAGLHENQTHSERRDAVSDFSGEIGRGQHPGAFDDVGSGRQLPDKRQGRSVPEPRCHQRVRGSLGHRSAAEGAAALHRLHRYHPHHDRPQAGGQLRADVARRRPPGPRGRPVASLLRLRHRFGDSPRGDPGAAVAAAVPGSAVQGAHHGHDPVRHQRAHAARRRFSAAAAALRLPPHCDRGHRPWQGEDHGRILPRGGSG
mmetsp:Transcript_14407/g.43573  ORF Transcript_14407/g.43573 Transcript_14407/m.43573 type:complete len:279 (-) Transcript_14407:576-1412(-)